MNLNFSIACTIASLIVQLCQCFSLSPNIENVSILSSKNGTSISADDNVEKGCISFPRSDIYSTKSAEVEATANQEHEHGAELSYVCSDQQFGIGGKLVCQNGQWHIIGDKCSSDTQDSIFMLNLSNDSGFATNHVKLALLALDQFCRIPHILHGYLASANGQTDRGRKVVETGEKVSIGSTFALECLSATLDTRTIPYQTIRCIEQQRWSLSPEEYNVRCPMPVGITVRSEDNAIAAIDKNGVKGCTAPQPQSMEREHWYDFPGCIDANGCQDRAEATAQVVLPGANVHFKCRNHEQYYLVGESTFSCGVNGEWIPEPDWPTCELKQSCSPPRQPEQGFFNADTDGREDFQPSDRLLVGCKKGYELIGAERLTCLNSGQWDAPVPVCQLREFALKRLIVLVTIISLLLLLLLVMAVFLVQRQIWLRKMERFGRRRLLDVPSEAYLPSLISAAAPGGPASSALHYQISTAAATYPGNGGQSAAHAAVATQHHFAATSPPAYQDRLALIAFSDDAPLPSYEEAVRRGPPSFDAVSTLSGYASRIGRRLPSLSSLWSRETAPPLRPLHSQEDSSNGTNPSSQSNVSRGFVTIHGAAIEPGSSWETMGALSEESANVRSDASSGQHTEASTQGQAGSLTSQSSLRGNGVSPVTDHTSSTEGVPLLEVDGSTSSDEDKALSD